MLGARTPHNSEQQPRVNVIYARVSTAKQKDDLERQVTFLRNKYPGHTIITDVGSGIHRNRKGLQSILDQCPQKSIGEVVVVHHD